MTKLVLSVVLVFLTSICYAQQRVTDFPEYTTLRDEMNLNRNYTYPRVIQKNDYQEDQEICNQDKSDAIYFTLYIIENMDTQYVSQDLFTSIVEALTYYPEFPLQKPYSKIYVADNLQISDIFTFTRRSSDIFVVEIYTEDSKNTLKLKLEETKSQSQTNLKEVSSTYTKTPHVSQDFIRGAWYALWNFQFNTYPTNFVFKDKNEERSYAEIRNLLLNYKWTDFCNNSDSIDLICRDYEKNHWKLSTQDRLSIEELVQRSLIAGM